MLGAIAAGTGNEVTTTDKGEGLETEADCVLFMLEVETLDKGNEVTTVACGRAALAGLPVTVVINRSVELFAPLA